MKPSRVQIYLLLASLLPVAAAAVGPSVPVPVAPGSLAGESLLAGACPSFHWAGVEGAERYELVVYAAGEGAGAEPVLSVSVPGTATGWSPSRDSCLEGGGRYAWSVRALGAAGGESWSPPAAFEVSGAPSLEEVERALEVLRRYREAREAREEQEVPGVAASGAERRPRENDTRGGGLTSAQRARLREREAVSRPPVASKPEELAGAGLAAGGAASRAPTASPTPSVSVDDQIHLGASSDFFRDGVSFLWADPSSANVALGGGALESTTSIFSTAVGDGALRSNTTGRDNSAFGSRALRYNTDGSNNSAFGAYALRDNTSGHNNSALGRWSLFHNTTGYYNSAVGAGALFANTTGSRNSAFGSVALSRNTAGLRNSAFGAAALRENSTGSDNSAFGETALSQNTAGDANSAFGARALLLNTTGNYNSAFGDGALLDNTDASANSAFGRYALTFNFTGSQNTAVGHYALRRNTTASYNTALGQAALSSNNGSENTAVGQRALENNTTAGFNTAVGQAAMRYNTTGYGNTALGENALKDNTTGSANIAIGRNAGVMLDGQSNNILIGNNGSGIGGVPEIRIGVQGNQLRTRIAGIAGISLSGGANVVVEPDGRLGVSASSKRFKEAIRDMGEVGEKLVKLRPVRFRYRDGPAGASSEAPGDRLEYGLIAEEVAEVLPELVALDADGRPYTVRYDLLSALLLRELQSRARVDVAQARRLAEQGREIAALRSRFDERRRRRR